MGKLNSMWGKILLSIIIFVGVWMYASHNSNARENNKTSLQKYYDTHPEEYRRDMNNQKYIEGVKKNIQDQEDKQNLN